MVFGVVSQSGGHVSADSAPNVGTTIRLYLPHAKTFSSATKHEPDTVEAALRARGETILVVEDNNALRHVGVRPLEAFGYRIIEANNATAALAQLKKNPVGDVVMPGGMDGFDLAKQVRRDWPSVGIALTSGYAGSHGSEHLTELATTVRLLKKPYDPNTPARAMRDMPDRRTR